jgi:hypothetical protein
MMRIGSLAGALCLLLASASLQAAARAWLEPDQIALGETATLNVEADSATAGAPDFGVLQRDFDLGGQSSSTQMSIVNGRAEARSRFSVVLEPRAAGNFTVPALTVGSSTTAPLTLVVARGTPGSAERGALLYFESELSSHDPYVQQAVAYTVRLYYAIPLVDGGVDVQAPDDASLKQVGEDRTRQQDIGGRRYTVFERRYLLTPDKSGPLSLPAPRFRGRRQSNDSFGFFNKVIPVSQVGKAEALNVRPLPASAPTPWLIANRLTLTRGALATEVRAGESLVLELLLVADGTTATQLPDLGLPGIQGAQVFPEPQQTRETIVDGRPQATATRRFAIVPAQPGTLLVPAVRVDYWNATSDRADAATLPAVSVAVTPGAAPTAAPSAPAPGTQVVPAQHAAPPANSSAPSRADHQALRLWQALTAGLMLAVALSLWWGWRRGRPGPAVEPASQATPARAAPVSAQDLQRALAGADLRAIAAALRATTSPPSPGVGALKPLLEDPAQRSAIEALEHSLWAAVADSGGVEHQQTLERLRQAFRHGPRFATARPALNEEVLPPLYPQRSSPGHSPQGKVVATLRNTLPSVEKTS